LWPVAELRIFSASEAKVPRIQTDAIPPEFYLVNPLDHRYPHSVLQVSNSTSSSPNLIVRCGKADDAELLAELGARTFFETFAADNTAEDVASYLAEAFNPAQQAAELADPRARLLIAETGEINKVAVGYAMIRSGDVPREVNGEKPIELVRLYAARESLGSGVGAALMQACIDEAKQRGYETLWLGVWEHNYRAQAFYRKCNFHEVGTHVFQLGDDPQTDILMQRSISE
jgi:ribosomal protein S18 acetylase RimI-like enzyme